MWAFKKNYLVAKLKKIYIFISKNKKHKFFDFNSFRKITKIQDKILVVNICRK